MFKHGKKISSKCNDILIIEDYVKIKLHNLLDEESIIKLFYEKQQAKLEIKKLTNKKYYKKFTRFLQKSFEMVSSI